MNIINFIINEWDSSLIVAFIIFLIGFMTKRGEKSKLKSILFELVTKAEQEYGGGTGELKYSVVVDWLYQRIPTVLKFLFTPKDISKMIESVLEYAKTKWKDNENIHEYSICVHTPISEETITNTVQQIASEIIKDADISDDSDDAEEDEESVDPEEAKG